jgi:hypothetical protein
MNIWLDPVTTAPKNFQFHCKNSMELLSYLSSEKITLISIGCDDISKMPEILSSALIIESLAANGKLPPLSWKIHTIPSSRLAAAVEILKIADSHWNRLYSRNTGYAVTKSGRLIVYPPIDP